LGSEPDAADTSTGGVASTTAGAGAAGALGGLSVLDASRHFAGQYACRLLADNGAKVVLVESPVDDPTVGRAAYAAGEEPAGDAAVFRHLNLGKLADPGLDLDLDLDGDREILVGRCCASDVAVVSDPALADAMRPWLDLRPTLLADGRAPRVPVD
jgi:crotonobetainyl-CoA:carnitine CoA-transferase CaiB-like acyl-CoA transferase